MSDPSTISQSEVDKAIADADEPVEEDVSAKKLHEIFSQKVDSGAGKKKSVWAMTMETFGMADGDVSKADVYVEGFDKAMAAMESLIDKSKKACQESPNKWELPWTPLASFAASERDVVVPFVKWSRKENEKAFNVSKAFRRYDSYVTWMESNAFRLKAFDPKNFEDISKGFGSAVSHDAKGRMIWWMDMGKLDWDGFANKKYSSDLLIQYVVWMTHLSFFDEKAQDNGMLLVEDMGKVGLWKMMTTFPMDVGTQMDRLTIGVLPIKMKKIYMMNVGTGMKVVMKLMTPFMSKKMKERFESVPPGQEATIIEEIGGKQYALKEYCSQLNGTASNDMIVERLGKPVEDEVVA